jgi:hypothetical protein
VSALLSTDGRSRSIVVAVGRSTDHWHVCSHAVLQANNWITLFNLRSPPRTRQGMPCAVSIQA